MSVEPRKIGEAMSADRERAIAAGCDDFDTKPVDMPRLLEKIAAGIVPTNVEIGEAALLALSL
jgi:CheY-like chemotaxis protein